MEHFEAQSLERKVFLGSIIQIELANIHGESIEDFIMRHASDFRKVIDEHPEFLDTFETDKESVLKEIGKIVYH